MKVFYFGKRFIFVVATYALGRKCSGIKAEQGFGSRGAEKIGDKVTAVVHHGECQPGRL